MRRIRDSINSFTVDSLTQAVGKASIEDESYFQKSLADLIETRDRTSQQLKDLGFTVLPSETNFVFAKHEDFTGEDIYLHLRKHNILVRFFNTPKLNEFVRITIGLPEDMQTLVDCLSDYIDRK